MLRKHVLSWCVVEIISIVMCDLPLGERLNKINEMYEKTSAVLILKDDMYH